MTYPALFVAVAMLTLFAAHARVSAQLVRPPPLITHAVADHALRSLHITGTDFEKKNNVTVSYDYAQDNIKKRIFSYG